MSNIKEALKNVETTIDNVLSDVAKGPRYVHQFATELANLLTISKYLKEKVKPSPAKKATKK